MIGLKSSLRGYKNGSKLLIIAYLDGAPIWTGIIQKTGIDEADITRILYKQNKHAYNDKQWAISTRWPIKILKTNPTEEDCKKLLFMIKTGIIT